MLVAADEWGFDPQTWICPNFCIHLKRVKFTLNEHINWASLFTICELRQQTTGSLLWLCTLVGITKTGKCFCFSLFFWQYFSFKGSASSDLWEPVAPRPPFLSQRKCLACRATWHATTTYQNSTAKWNTSSYCSCKTSPHICPNFQLWHKVRKALEVYGCHFRFSLIRRSWTTHQAAPRFTDFTLTGKTP